MAQMGRPRKEIDWGIVETLCGLHCTRDEIAGALKISADTLEKRIRESYDLTFKAYFDQKSSNGKISLRRKQYEMAIAGDRVMLIWLGKQYLDQRDNRDMQISNAPGDVKGLIIHLDKHQE